MKHLATLALGLGIALGTGPAAAEPSLRANVTVTGAFVTLGDLFDGLAGGADTAVFQAPDPGTTGSVSASRVLAAAAAHGVDAPATTPAKVSVTRASRVIAEDEIRHALAEALASHDAAGAAGAEGELQIRLDGSEAPYHVEADALAPLSGGDCELDRSTRRFGCVLRVADSQLMAEGTRVTGHALVMVDLPVLQRPVRRGETIGAADVVIARVPLSEAPGEAVRDLGEIVGKSARSSLRAGAPVPADRLMRPILVGRNDAVTIIYRAGGLILTARGRALAEGARGDLVTVMNSHSNRTLEATVAGAGQVVVEPSREIAAAFASN